MFGYRIPGQDIVGWFATVDAALQALAHQWQRQGVYRDSRVVQVGPVADGRFVGVPEMLRCEIALDGLVTWKRIN
jgi:hypothetical protein